MELIVYTNYMKDNTGYLHDVEIPMDYFSYYSGTNKLLVYKEETGFIQLDVSKIRQITARSEGMYNNSVFFNTKKEVEHLPKDTTREELLKLLIVEGDH